jgi:ATP-dependent Clp protease ATP-binding subunit ClpA
LDWPWQITAAPNASQAAWIAARPSLKCAARERLSGQGKGLKAVLCQADILKSTYDDIDIAIDYLLLALSMDDRCSKQLGSQASATTDNLEDVVQSIRGCHTATDQSPHGASAFLETSGREITKAVELENGTLAKLHKKLAAKEVVLDASSGDTTLLREEVTEDDIAEVIAQWARTSLAKPVESEMEKPLQLKEELHTRVIGPDQSVTAVADAIQRSRAVLSDPNRPIASFLFLGPTGVGKAELSKTLVSQLFDSKESMVRIDRRKCIERHAVSRLIGAPPRYGGSDPVHQFGRSSAPSNGNGKPRLPRASWWGQSPQGRGERRLRVSQSDPANLPVFV